MAREILHFAQNDKGKYLLTLDIVVGTRLIASAQARRLYGKDTINRVPTATRIDGELDAAMEVKRFTFFL